jgi:hypothetical protein
MKEQVELWRSVLAPHSREHFNNYTFVLDRDKGLVQALKETFLKKHATQWQYTYSPQRFE